VTGALPAAPDPQAPRAAAAAGGKKGALDRAEGPPRLPERENDHARQEGECPPQRAGIGRKPRRLRDHQAVPPATWRRTASQTSFRKWLKSSLRTVASRPPRRSTPMANSCTIRPGRADITSTRPER